MMKQSVLLSAALFLMHCSGGSGLSGDSGEDTRADPTEDRAEDYIDRADSADTGEGVDTTDTGHDILPDELVDGVDPCAPQDAWAEGPCAAIVPGIKWDGRGCIGLGSGCGCAGSDCESVYDTIEECVEARLACYSASCDPQPVADDMCIDCFDPYYLGTFWNGRECFELRGCNCRGEGCSEGFYSIYECEAVLAGCDAALCTATGGQWFPASAGFCDFLCGAPTDDDCVAPVCNCGPGRTFASGSGCQADPSCSEELLCLATRGHWYPASECVCGFTCGRPNPCDACLDSCDCGPHRTFDPSTGCDPDPSCGPAAEEEVCTSTGGEWNDNSEFPVSCGHFFCGFPNTLDPCVMPGCDCGPVSNFDSTHGCVYDDGCVLRNAGQECLGSAAHSSCRPGLVCCNYCGVPPGCPACQDPCCPDSDICMDDGCMIPPP